jgi:hypothetical protein
LERQGDTLPTPRPGEPQRAGTPADADDDNARIARHIRDRVRAGENLNTITTRSVASAVGLSPATVCRSGVWKAFEAERGARASTRVSGRDQQLTGEMLAVIHDRRAVDPAEEAEMAEEVERAKKAEAELEALIAEHQQDMNDPDAAEAEREALARRRRTR